MPRITIVAYKETVPEELIRLNAVIREEDRSWRWTKMSIHTQDIKSFEDTEEGETMLMLWGEEGEDCYNLLIHEDFDSFDERLKLIEEPINEAYTPEEEEHEEAENG